MKNAIYYAGLGGGKEPAMYKILAHFGYKLQQEDLDYYDIWYTDKGKAFMEEEIKKAKNTDLIIGISFGGYVAYHVARATGKKCILINPALDRAKTTTGIYDFDMAYEAKKFPLNIYLAPEDNVVPYRYTTNYIKKNNIECEVYYIEEMDHCPSYQELIQILRHNIDLPKVSK